MEVNFIALRGEEIRSHFEDLAQLRIEVFKEFPYIYEGDLDYEKKYLETYMKTTKSLVVIAQIDGKTIGATTCIPLELEQDEIIAPFFDRGMNIRKIMYFGESIILKPYRGKNIGSQFFQLREEEANAQFEDLEWTTFCSVIRPENHPLRPKDYKPLDNFWNRRGYTKDPKMKITLPWKDINEEKETQKDLAIWLKRWT